MYLEEISQNQSKLLGFINSLHFNNEEAKDILQETNITLINKQEDFDDTKQFLPWAFAVARFTWLAHKKKKAIELKNILYDSHITNILLDQKSSALKREINYDIEAERLRLLDLVREELTNKQRSLLDALLDGQSLQEIADNCGSKYGTIQTLKVRTIRRVRDIILRIKYRERTHENATIQKAKQKAWEEKENIQETKGGHFKPSAGGAQL